MARPARLGLLVLSLLMVGGARADRRPATDPAPTSEGSWLWNPKPVRPRPPAPPRPPRPVATPGDQVRAASVAAGLVARWSFDDGTAADVSGRGHHGKILGGARLVTLGAGNRALRFDGVSARVEVPDHPDFHMTDGLTLAVRVNPDRVEGLQTLVNKWYALDSYMLLLESGNARFSLAFPGGGQWGSVVNLDAPVQADRWVRVVGTFEGKAHRLFLDGELVASGELAANRRSLQSSDRPLVIGHHPDWNAFQGMIDEVRIYDRALTAEAVRDLLMPSPPPPGRERTPAVPVR